MTNFNFLPRKELFLIIKYMNSFSLPFTSHQINRDLRTTYLQQYQSQTAPFHQTDPDPLKDITDKYGFEWNPSGKLLKKKYQFTGQRNKKDYFCTQSRTKPVQKLLKLENCKHPEIDKRIEEVYGKYESRGKKGSRKIVQKVEQKENELVPKFGSVQQKKEEKCRKKKQHISRIDIKEVDSKIDKITQRIKEREKKKQILSISYTPFILSKEEKHKLSIASFQASEKQVINGKQMDDFAKSKISFCENLTHDEPNQQTITVEEIQNFIDLLCKQIEFDQIFTKLKVRFDQNENPHKWGILSDFLLQIGKPMKYHQLFDTFSSHNKQFDQYLTETDNDVYKELIEAYNNSQTHWQMKIRNKIKEQELLRQNFTLNELDIEGKGMVKVEGIVKYLNQRKNMYINGDLELIFKRIGGRKKEIRYSQLLKSLSQQSY